MAATHAAMLKILQEAALECNPARRSVVHPETVALSVMMEHGISHSVAGGTITDLLRRTRETKPAQAAAAQEALPMLLKAASEPVVSTTSVVEEDCVRRTTSLRPRTRRSSVSRYEHGQDPEERRALARAAKRKKACRERKTRQHRGAIKRRALWSAECGELEGMIRHRREAREPFNESSFPLLVNESYGADEMPANTELRRTARSPRSPRSSARIEATIEYLLAVARRIRDHAINTSDGQEDTSEMMEMEESIMACVDELDDIPRTFPKACFSSRRVSS